jgi:hypothetical protein
MTPPVPGPLDLITAAMLAAAYIAAGIYGLIVSPRDVRSRTFMGLAVINAVFAFLPVRGFDRPTVVAALCAAALGSVALFHFAMVFPWRQRWFRGRVAWMTGLYILPPVAIVVLNWYAPRSAEDLSLTDLLVLSAAGIPLLILLAVVLPLAALMALYGNIRRARRQRVRAAYAPTLGIFVSELGGGLLAAILGVLLQTLGFGRATVAGITVAVFALNVVAPISFAAGVGHYRVLSLDPDAI